MKRFDILASGPRSVYPARRRNHVHRVSITTFIALVGTAALAAQSNPFSNDARQQYALVKGSLLKAAEKMPAENYSFRTVPEVRTFGEMIAHVADAGLMMCGVVKGEKVTANARSKTSKADLVAALKASFDY